MVIDILYNFYPIWGIILKEIQLFGITGTVLYFVESSLFSMVPILSI